MTQVKGTALVSTVRFLNERFGPEGARRVLEGLTPEERGLIGMSIVSAWYPLSLMLKLMREAERHFGASAPQLYREMGRASADYGLTTVYKIFFKVGSPQFIISRASRVFGGYYDSGEMRAVVSEKGHAIIELSGFADPAPELCERILGWMERTVELSGGRDLRGTHVSCVCRGDASCRFEGHWS